MHLTWIRKAKELCATHIILVYDTEDKKEYPVFVKRNEDVGDEVKKIRLSEGKQEVRDVIDI